MHLREFFLSKPKACVNTAGRLPTEPAQAASKRRQARALVLRSVTGEYWAPLGTWVVREAALAAMRTPPERYATLVEGAAALDRRYGDASWRAKSTLLPRMRAERTLSDFF